MHAPLPTGDHIAHGVQPNSLTRSTRKSNEKCVSDYTVRYCGGTAGTTTECYGRQTPCHSNERSTKPLLDDAERGATAMRIALGCNIIHPDR